MSVSNMPHHGEAGSNSWGAGYGDIALDKRVPRSNTSNILLEGVSFGSLACSAYLIEFIRGEVLQDFDTGKQRYSSSLIAPCNPFLQRGNNVGKVQEYPGCFFLRLESVGSMGTLESCREAPSS
jgi:hypothetical protein